MPLTNKRAYNSEFRRAQAQQTRGRILTAAKKLFETDGFEQVTIEQLAQAADVSTPTVYALFQSKRGVLRGVMNELVAPADYEYLLEEAWLEKEPVKRFILFAHIATKVYNAERDQMNLFRGASVVHPEFRALEVEREERRYAKQLRYIEEMAEAAFFKDGMGLEEVRDIVWVFTGRDLYRMLVIERGWSSDAYEKWLGQSLIQLLAASSPPHSALSGTILSKNSSTGMTGKPR